MAFVVRTVPIQDSGRAQGAFNALLRSHKLLSVDRRWVEQGASSFGSLCIDYLEGAPAEGGGRGPGGTGKIDDREPLSPAAFAAFARQRDVRKERAQAEGVPVSTIVTDAQLAPLVQSRATTKAALEKIAGVGDARIENRRLAAPAAGQGQGRWGRGGRSRRTRSAAAGAAATPAGPGPAPHSGRAFPVAPIQPG
jgi:hypothetical protein